MKHKFRMIALRGRLFDGDPMHMSTSVVGTTQGLFIDAKTANELAAEIARRWNTVAENAEKSDGSLPTGVPNLTLSGSGKYSLADDYNKAIIATEAAIMALDETAPHPRDYQWAADFRQAVREHKARRRRLQSVVNELAYLMNEVLK